MKLTTKGRYAVMAMSDIAANGACGPVSLADIAERQKISLSYLEQLFGRLRRDGLVESVRGPGGGYGLARPAGDIRIVDIIYAVQEDIQTVRCDPNARVGCTGQTSRCLTHDLWDELGRQILIFLSSISLLDVIERRVLGVARPPRTAAGDEAEADTAPDVAAELLEALVQ